jgi:hypothetical protein
MAKITLNVKKTFEAKRLIVSAGVKYWDDATVNGEEDTDGMLMPYRAGDRWLPVIDIDSGTILDWPSDKTADINYKVCDDGKYTLVDENQDDICTIDGYVPNIMCPERGGYGDYIIMKVNEFGKINNWKCDLSDFVEEKEEDSWMK